MQYRKSRQRNRILELIQHTNVHPTAEWIYAQLKKEMPQLSLGTVYRNLNVLAEQGMVQKLPFEGGFDRFEGNLRPHCHLICEGCGSVEDFEMPRNKELDKKIEKKSPFKVTGHRIDFFGLCEKCQKRQSSRK
jgi:Fe2+ or Zn2+ uptake regulation protein